MLQLQIIKKRPLELAEAEGKTEAANLLKQHLSQKLYQAALRNDVKECAKCLTAGADPNYQSEASGNTALHIAATSQEHLGVAQQLIISGANITSTNEQGQTPLDIAQQCNSVEITEILQKYANAKLYQAVKEDDTAQHTQLIRHGANVNWQSSQFGNTLLHNAVSEGNLKVVNQLLNLGADPMLKNGAGKNPLELAQETGESAITDAILKATSQASTKISSVQVEQTAGKSQGR